jgi:hypothetical protein
MGARRLFVAAIVGLGALAFAGAAQACSCAPMPVKAAVRQADAALVGKLLKVVPRGRSQADYRYLVQRVYKNDGNLAGGAVISVRSARAAAACSLPGGVGRSYGLLLRAGSASAGEARWSGGRCGVLAPKELQAVASGRSVRGATSSCAS